MADLLQTIPSEDGACEVMEDGIHCEHWWDGEACCACGARGMTDAEKFEQGMLDETGEHG